MEEKPTPTPPTSNEPHAAEVNANAEAESRAYEEARDQTRDYVNGEVRAREEAEAQERSEAEAAGPICVDDLLKTGDAEPEPGIPDVDLGRAASILESLLLVSSDPLSIDKARQILGGITREQFDEVHLILQAKYSGEASGVLLERVAKGLQFRTNPANQDHVRKLFDVKPPRFSRAALETVAIIAYKQPLTRQEIEQIRGVDCAGSLKTLMERRLVRVVGKKDVPGKPFLFGTTREFMEVFSLGSLSELPTMREIEAYLASSTATHVETGRPGIDLPPAAGEAADQGENGAAAGPGDASQPEKRPEEAAMEEIGPDEAAPNEGNGNPDAD